MVHQLSLYSTIPHTSFAQTVATLRALTGLVSPEPISTYTLTTKPYNVFKPKFEPGKVNQIDQFFMKCITTWTSTDLKLSEIARPIIEDNDLITERILGDGSDRAWTLQISDIPIAGKNQQCSAQTIYESTLVHRHSKRTRKDIANPPIKSGEEDVQEIKAEEMHPEVANDKHELVNNDSDIKGDSFLDFLGDLGYDIANEFWIKGVRFFYGNIVIEIYKVFVKSHGNNQGKDLISLKLLDESNTFQVKAFINIPKSIDVELKNQGTKELLNLQEILKNSIVLEIPDRQYMDSRIIS